MADDTVTLGALQLNNKINYFVMAKGGVFNVGNQTVEWEEEPNYAGGANVQVNVRRGKLIPVTIPMMVKGSSVSDLEAKLAALWAEVDKTSNTLIVGSNSYQIVNSGRSDNLVFDNDYVVGYRTWFTLTLVRKP